VLLKYNDCDNYVLDRGIRVAHAKILHNRLSNKKIERKSPEIVAIDTVFRIVMRNFLIPRYPLIFSPEYVAVWMSGNIVFLLS
jgi:hypothetical protein